MDPNLVYQKTSSGEEAMRQRTKVVQRNQRMVLILVDGKASVADLCDKTGNPQMTVAMLRELEKDGFVVPLSAIESAWMWEQSRKIAQEIKAAVAQVSHSSARKKSAAPEETARPASEEPTLHAKPKPASFPAPAASRSTLKREANDNTFSTFETEGQVREAMRRQQESLEGVKKEESAVKNSSRRRASRRRKDDVDSQIKPIRRGERTSNLAWVTRLALAFSLVIMLALGAMLLFPYSRYLPEIESALSQGVGKPARVGVVSVAFFPKPGMFLRDVRLGEDSASDTLHLAEVRFLPELGSLFSSRVVLRDVEVSGMNLSPKSLMALPQVFVAMAQTTSSFSAQRVTFGNIGFSLRGMGLSGLSGRAEFDATHSMNALTLETTDRKLRVETRPTDTAVGISLEGYGWKPLESSPLVFDSLKIKGILSADAFRAEVIDLHFFDGSIQGAALFDASKSSALAGRLTFERLNAKKLGEVFGLTALLEGDVSGRIEFSSLAETWGGLLPALTASGDFIARRGAVMGLDLAEVIRRASSSPVRGGMTRFEQLGGNFSVIPENIRLTNLSLVSGLMQSSGAIAIGKNQQLSGSMNVLMRGFTNQVSMPVTVAGTLKTPEAQSMK